jgi:predicted dehydrogenase
MPAPPSGRADDTLRVGIVGAGMIATFAHGYLPGLRHANGIRVAAITDHGRETADKVAAKWDIPLVFDTLDEMLASDAVDAVINLTPAPVHHEVAMKVISSRLHLVTEKPIAATLPEADEICRAAATAGVVVVTAPMDMLSAEWQEARRLVASGALGKVAFARVQSSHAGAAAYSWPGDPSPFYQVGVGSLMDLGVYGITRITGVLGPAQRVSSFAGITSPTRRVEGGPFDGRVFEVGEADNVVALLDFGEATYALLDATYNVLASRAPEMELYGAKGTMVVNKPDSPEGLNLELYLAEAAPGLAGWVTPKPVSPFVAADLTKTMARGSLVQHLRDCLREGRRPVASAEHARHVLEIMLAVRESAATGASVDLTTSFEPGS